MIIIRRKAVSKNKIQNKKTNNFSIYLFLLLFKIDFQSQFSKFNIIKKLIAKNVIYSISIQLILSRAHVSLSIF